MIRVLTEPAASSFRRQEFREDTWPDGVLVIANSAAQAAAYKRRSGAGAALVESFDNFAGRALVWAENLDGIISRETWRVLVRLEMESEAGRYEALTGGGGRISNGVLREVCGALVRMERVGTDRGSGPRGQQLAALHVAMQSRVQRGGFVIEDAAVLQGWQDLNADQWGRLYPGVKRVVFDGIDYFSHLHLVIIQAVVRCGGEAVVLVGLDPEMDLGRYPHLESSLSLLDEVFPSPGDEASSAGELPENLSEVGRTVVVTVNNRCREGSSVAAVVDSLRQNALTKCVVVSPDNASVRQGLVQACREFGLTFSSHEKPKVLESPELALLQLLGVFSTGVVTDTLPQLLAHPYVNCILPGRTSEDLRRASHVVHEILMKYGRMESIKEVMASVEDAYGRAVRAENAATDEEGTTTAWTRDLTAVLQILRQMDELEKELGAKYPIGHWEEWVWRFVGSVDSHKAMSGNRAILDIVYATARNLSIIAAEIKPQKVRFNYYLSLLRTALYGVKLDVAADDDADVKLMAMDDAIHAGADVLFALGIHDGAFPRLPTERADIGGAEPLQTDGDLQISAQRLLFDRLLVSAPRVLLVEAEQEGQNLLLSSPFVEELVQQGRATILNFQALEQAMHLDNGGKVAKVERHLSAQLQRKQIELSAIPIICGDDLFARHVVWNTSANALRTAETLGPFDGFINDKSLLQWLNAEGHRRVFSVAQFDSLVNCPYRFFLERLVRVSEMDGQDVLLSAQEMGVIVHDILKTFHEMWYQEFGPTVLAAEPERARTLARDVASEVIGRLHLPAFARSLVTGRILGLGGVGAGMLPGLVNAYVECEIERTTKCGNAALAPAFFELSFGKGEGMPITFSGNQVLVRGTIDRIDMNQEAFSVIDYKTSKVSSRQAVLDGYLIQLPVYAIAAAHLLTRLAPQVRDCAGGMYYYVGPSKAAAQGPLMRKAFKSFSSFTGYGLEDEAFEGVMAMVDYLVGEGISKFKNGVFHVTARREDLACRYCPYDRICRKDLSRVEAHFAGIGGTV